jgi:hypothetical protein
MAKLRTPSLLVKGKKVLLEKFSGMGNGYTFPLETLIFYALCIGAVSQGSQRYSDVSAYGDDLIVPACDTDLLREVFTYCGFVMNEDKSFTQGRFYESCGLDFFDGINVRSLYLKRELTTVDAVMDMAAGIVSYAKLGLRSPFADSRFLPLYRLCVDALPSWARELRGPHGLSGCLSSPFDKAVPQRAGFSQGWEGYWIRIVSPDPVKDPGWNGEAHLLDKLSRPNQLGHNVVRRGVSGYRIRTVYVLKYTDMSWQ